MSAQTAHDMRGIADTFNQNDVSGYLAGILKDILERAEQGYYSVSVCIPSEANDLHSLVAQLERRGYRVSEYNSYVHTAKVTWG